MAEGRYCIEKMTAYYWDTKTEKWQRTNRCSDSLEMISQFMGEDCRIVDMQTGKEIARRVYLDTWR